MRLLLHGRRLALHVHETDGALAIPHRVYGIRRLEGLHVIDHGCSRLQCSAHDRGPTRIDRNAKIVDFFQHRQHALQLFDLGHGRGARTRGLAADVDDVGAFRGQLAGVLHGGVWLEKQAAVGKRIGRDVHHAHDQGFR